VYRNKNYKITTRLIIIIIIIKSVGMIEIERK
jgi:hypothetical protein